MRSRFVLLMITALALVVSLGGIVTAEENEIRVGMVGPQTGWAAVYGSHVVDGAKLALSEVGGKFRDRPIRLLIADTKGQTDKTIEILDTFKNRDKVHVVIGPSLGNEGLGLADWASRNHDLPVLVGYSAPEDVTMREHSRNVLRPGWTGSQVIFHFGRFVAQDLGYKKIIMVGQDYAYPWGQIAGFIRGFLENGGEEVYRIWHPVEQLDFGSILTQLQGLANDYDAVLVNSSGAQTIAFFNQWTQYGMSSFYPPPLGGANVTDPVILDELGPDALGVYSSMHYVGGLKNENNVRFKTAFYDMFGYAPGAIAVQGYDAIKCILKALAAVNGNIEDTEAFIDALYKVKMPESPKGPWYFDERGQAVQNIYIQKVEEVDGKLTNVPLRTYVEVSQFGPYLGMKEEYMSQPVNTRTYPYGTRDEHLAEVAKYFGEEYVESLTVPRGWTGPAIEYVEGEYIQ